MGIPARNATRHDAGNDEGVVGCFVIADQPIQGSRLAPGLYLVATPIGNLGDITLRALQALAGADVIACEDTRVTRKLLDRYAIATPLTPYHDHNAAQARPALLRRLADGAAVALRSVSVGRLPAAKGHRAPQPHCRARPHPGDAGAVRDRAAACGDAHRP